MANDPAFLFYPGDYLRDTQCLSEQAQVAYDRIMCEHMRNICISQPLLNFFTKRLTPDQKQELETILTKVPGGYQIRWVAESIEKRKEYSESRRKNRNSTKNISLSYVPHMENENRNENENEKTKELFLDPFDDLWVERNLTMKASLYPGVDLQLELQRFRAKIAAAPQDYSGHDTNGLRKALLYHISHAPKSADTKQPRKKAFEL